MPRFKPTRTACVLVFSAALTSVLFFYPSVIGATLHQNLYPTDYQPIEIEQEVLAQDPQFVPAPPPAVAPLAVPGTARKHGQSRSGHWGWLSYFSPSVTSEEEDVDVVYADDGLVRGWELEEDLPKTGYIRLSETVRKRHPIHDLIARGQARWTALLER